MIILDSMDRAKFAWPRWPFRKVPKNLETIHRPRLVLAAAIAHGFTTCLYVAQENVSHGADAFLEILSRPGIGSVPAYGSPGVRQPVSGILAVPESGGSVPASGSSCNLAIKVLDHREGLPNLPASEPADATTPGRAG